jgi:hypothetical protein
MEIPDFKEYGGKNAYPSVFHSRLLTLGTSPLPLLSADFEIIL